MKLYTKMGDAGQTSLASGERVAKTDSAIAVVGALDELSAQVGLVLAQYLDSSGGETDRQLLLRIQSVALAAGAWAVAANPAILQKLTAPVLPADISDLEQRIDQLSDQLPPLTNFILPGGNPEAASLHLLRAVARRAERVWLDLPLATSSTDPWPIFAQYWNRLSDYLFVLARWANQQAGVAEVTWNN